MLNLRKGNLPCFQWEVERFQHIHKERMAAVTGQTNNRPTQPKQQRRRAALKKNNTTRGMLAEMDVKRKNVFLVEKMVHIHRIGGFQRRFLNEFRDVKAALHFGKTNAGVSQAAHEHRFTRRKKAQELVRKENAKLFTRLVRELSKKCSAISPTGPLASPIRSGIDFNKFERDFSKSREHRRLAQCDRTVGHTSVFSSTKTRAPCSGADNTLCDAAYPGKGGHFTRDMGSRPPRQPNPEPSNGSLPTRGDEKIHSSTNSPGGSFNRSTVQNKDRSCGGVHGRSVVSRRRPQTATGCRRPSITNRPQTALGFRRESGDQDLFDARAADPGWGTIGVSNTSRGARSSTTEDASFAAAPRRRGLRPSRTFSDDTGMAKIRQSWRPARTEPTNCGSRSEGQRNSNDSNISGNGRTVSTAWGSLYGQMERDKDGQLWFLGRTLLAEAKVLISGVQTDGQRSNGRREGRRGGGVGEKVKLRFLSLDGLIRHGEQVRKTLRGFEVEASLVTPRGCAIERTRGGHKSGNTGVGSGSASVSAVQEYLENICAGAGRDGFESSSALASFREVHPLDECGNYPEICEILEQAGQRDLCQTVLGSCRVVTSHERTGKIDVQLLRESDDGWGLSATVPSGAGACLRTSGHDLKPTASGRDHVVVRDDIEIEAGRSAAATTTAEQVLVREAATRDGESGRKDTAGQHTCASHLGGNGVRGCIPTTFGVEGRGKTSSIVVRVPLASRNSYNSSNVGPKDGSESKSNEQDDDDDDNNDDSVEEDASEDEDSSV